MSKIKRLLQHYAAFISIPWRDDTPAEQRVIFCVYKEMDERALRAKVSEFELSTREAGHDWALFDLTDTFATWLSSQRYAKSYFKRPDLLPTLLPQYREYLIREFDQFLAQHEVGKNHVVALQGVGSLFGFIKVKAVVDCFAPKVPGKLLVLFPGSYEKDNYRLLDGYDGWNYLAIPITAD